MFGYYLDFILGALLVIFAITSTILNPIIFLSNLKNTPSQVMFRVIAVSDLLTNLFIPIFIALRCFSVELDANGRPATLQEQGLTLLYLTMTCISATTVAILGVTRYISMRLPFYRIRKNFLYVACGGFAVTALTVNLIGVVTSGSYWCSYEQLALQTMNYKSVVFVMIRVKYQVNGVVSIVVSVLTYKLLSKKNAVKDAVGIASNHGKSSKTIIYMNIGNFIQSVVVFTFILTKSTNPDIETLKYLQFAGTCFIPIALSSFNPIIMLIRSKTIQQNSWNMVKALRTGSWGHSKSLSIKVNQIQVVNGKFSSQRTKTSSSKDSLSVTFQNLAAHNPHIDIDCS